MSFLTLFGSYLVINIFENWLNCREIAYFDSAICSQQYRQKFLGAFQGRLVGRNRDSKLTIRRYFCRWAVSRSMRFRNLMICNYDAQCIALNNNMETVADVMHFHLNHCFRDSVENVVRILGNVKELQELALLNSGHISDGHMAVIFENLSALTKCDLSGLYRTTDRTLLDLSRASKGLHSINLSICPEITDIGIESLVTNCPQLTNIVFLNQHKITDRSVDHITKHCPGLTSLDLTHCLHITDTAIVKLSEKLSTTLKELSICGCLKALTDTAIYSISKYCIALTKLNIGRTKLSTDYSDGLGKCLTTNQALTTLGESCTLLTDLCVNRQYGLSHGTSTIVGIMKNLPYLRRIQFYNLDNEHLEWLVIELFSEKMACLHVVDLQENILEGVPYPEDEYKRQQTLLSRWLDEQQNYPMRFKPMRVVGGMLSKCDKLRILRAGYNTDSTVLMIALIESTRCLQDLCLDRCQHGVIDFNLLQTMSNYCHYLTHFSAGGGTVSEEWIIDFIAKNRYLTHITIDYHQTLSDHVIISIAKCRRKLQKLSLRFCVNLTDASIYALAAHCPALTSLDLTNCHGITKDASVIELIEKCHYLECLEVRKTGLSMEMKSKIIAKYFPVND